MKWRIESKTHILSDKGYKVARFGSKGNFRYRASNPSGQWIGKVVSTSDEAKKLCEADFSGK